MDAKAEIVLTGIYGVFLLALAHGLIVYGRKNYGPRNRAIRHLFPEIANPHTSDFGGWGWPHGEAARFVVGVALVITVVTLFIATVMLLRHHDATALMVLGPVTAAAGASGRSMLRLFSKRHDHT